MTLFTNILTGGSNNHETTSEAANGLATDLVSEGVVGAITNTSGVAPATGGFAVNAQSPAAMAVDVSPGVAYVTATPSSQSSQTLRVRSTATEEVTIAANSTGATRYDWIYLSVDAANAADPAVAGDDVTTLVVSRSTSSASDDGTPPTYGYLLAKVTVANGASSIANASIADSRSNITGPVNFVNAQAMADASVLPEHLVASTGTSWVWQSWTPTLGNITLGNGTVVAKYIQAGKTIDAFFKLTCGSTTSIGNAVTITLPVNCHADHATYSPIGIVSINDGGATAYAGLALRDPSGNDKVIFTFDVSSTGNQTGTFPLAEATGDVLAASLRYEAA